MLHALSFLRKISPTLCLSLVAIALALPAQAQESIGRVTASKGNTVITRDGKTLPATVGSELQAVDVLRTSEGGNASILFTDGSRVLLGPNSQLAMESYAFDQSSKKGNLMFNFTKGTMRMISGAINKSNPDQASIKTPAATAGIRGTDFIIDVPSTGN